MMQASTFLETDVLLNGPKVSVIMPAYNCGATIGRALTSITNDKYQNFEVLIFNDNSIDNTHDVVMQFAATDPRIKYFSSPTNRGAGYARRFLLNLAEGEIFAFLDSDDYWSGDKLQKQVAALFENNADIVTSGYWIVSVDNVCIGERKPIDNITYWKMLVSNWLPMSMTIVRADLVGARIMPEIRKRQDYGYWLQIFRSNKVRCFTIKENLGSYTKSTTSLSSNKLDNFKYNYLMFRNVVHFNKFRALIHTLLNTIFYIFVKIFRSS